MATYKEIAPSDVKQQRSFLEQLVDVIQQSISGSSTRREYQVFVTGGMGPGVTSSLFQTVYDQDFTRQTANPVFDMTVGLFSSGSTVLATQTGVDAANKPLFPSNTLMMREKINIYSQFAQALLGDASLPFVASPDSAAQSDIIDSAMFIAFRRLFARDRIKRETFSMAWYKVANLDPAGGATKPSNVPSSSFGNVPNIDITTILSGTVLTDFGSSGDRIVLRGGEVGNVFDASDTTKPVGLMFYDSGVLVLDLAKIISGSQHVSGVVSAVTGGFVQDVNPGQTLIGTSNPNFPLANRDAKFIPDLMVSGSIDDIVDHFASCRVSSGSLSAMTFQNLTTINSSLYFCRASADEFNYSSNPTFVDTNNRIVVIDEGQEDVQQSFTFITTVGLYDANDNLLAVAKLSRPVQKDAGRDLTLRVRLDY